MTIYVQRMVTAMNAADGSIIDLTQDRWTREERNEKLDGKRARSRHHIDSVCRECGGGVHYHTNAHGSFWWQHNPGEARRCLTRDIKPNGESDEHYAAKFAVTRTLRLNGWEADPERTFQKGGRIVRPDVHAWHEHSPVAHQRPTDWEIQLTHQGPGDFIARTEEHLEVSGHRTAWVTPFDEELDRQLGVVTDPTGLYVAARVYETASEEVPLTTMTVSEFVAKTQKRRRELIWADAGYANRWIAYPPGQKPIVDTWAAPPPTDPADGDVVILDRYCARPPAEPKAPAPQLALPITKAEALSSGGDRRRRSSGQGRRAATGRFAIGDVIRNRITGRYGPIVEVFGQRQPTYRIVDNDGTWPVPERIAERVIGREG